MKRGGRLNRSAELKSKKPLERGTSQLKAGRKKPRSDREKEMQSAWYQAVVRSARVCAVTGQPGTAADPLEGHHVVEQEALKKHASKHGLDVVGLLWDPRNGMPVLRSVHARHTNRFDPIPFGCVPVAAQDFADELGLAWRIVRDYPA